jgi:hypothetical protein
MRLRMIVVLAFLALGAAGAFAQDLPFFFTDPDAIGSGFGSNQPHWSATKASTFGVISTPFDAVVDVLTIGAGPSFTDLKDPIVLGGFDNLLLGTATVAAPPNGPIYAGYFSPGKVPFSLFASFNHTSAAAEAANTTTYAGSQSTIVGSTTYQWYNDITEQANQVRPFASVQNDVLQSVVSFGPIVGGLALGLSGTDLATAATNYTSTETLYYDTTPGAKPTPTANYTITSTAAAAGGSNFTFGAGVPVLLKSGPMSHFINLQAVFSGTDNSSSTVTTRTAPADPAAGAGSFSNVNDATVNKTSGTTVAAGYALMLPGLLSKASKDNKFLADVDMNVTIAGAEYTVSNNSALMTYAGGGNTATTASTLTSTTQSRTFSPGVGFKVGAGALHSFYFTPAPGVQIGVIPTMYLDYQSLVPTATLTNDTTAVLTDVNNNGVQDAGDTVANTVIDYTNALSDGNRIQNQGLFEGYAAMPMAVTIKPAGWIFGFTVGTAPSMYYSNTTTYNLAYTKTTSTSTTTVGGATTTPTVTNASIAPTSTSLNTWNFVEAHKFSLNFEFGDVKMDVILNAVNLFVFDSVSLSIYAALK